MPRRIALIHAVTAAIAPVEAAFRDHWPEARTGNLLDDSLVADLNDFGTPKGPLADRIVALGRYAEQTGVDGILYTCSAFADAIDRARLVLSVPVLKPDEAMIDEALDDGAPIAVLTTFRPAVDMAVGQIQAEAKRRGASVAVSGHFVEGAMAALADGDGARHDALIAAAARNLPVEASVVLAQFSMARALPAVAAVREGPVHTAPDAAVQRLKSLLESSAVGSAARVLM